MALSRSSTPNRKERLSSLAGGVRLRGKIGEIWSQGQKVGLVFEWMLNGWAAEWKMEAERYRINFLPDGHRTVELRLDMRIGIVKAKGIIWTDPVIDGRSHRAIVVKGGNLQWEKQEPVVPRNS